MIIQEKIKSLNRRIEQKNKALEKLELKKERINKKLSGLADDLLAYNNGTYKGGDTEYGIKYDIEELQYDLNIVHREIRDTELSMNKLKNDLDIALLEKSELDGTYVIESLETLLEQWEIVAKCYYMNKYNELKDIKERKDIDYKKQRKLIMDNIPLVVIKMFTRDKEEFVTKVTDLIKKDKEILKQNFYTRCNKVVGRITSADLTLNNGEINGIVAGELGRAKINTILCGGYNIQCLHLRTIVTKF